MASRLDLTGRVNAVRCYDERALHGLPVFKLCRHPIVLARDRGELVLPADIHALREPLSKASLVCSEGPINGCALGIATTAAASVLAGSDVEGEVRLYGSVAIQGGIDCSGTSKGSLVKLEELAEWSVRMLAQVEAVSCVATFRGALKDDGRDVVLDQRAGDCVGGEFRMSR